MSYAEKLLSRGEEIVYSSRQHWFAIIARMWVWLLIVIVALAILLSFLLAPAVRGLERWKLGRVLSTLIVVLLGFSLIGAESLSEGTVSVSHAHWFMAAMRRSGRNDLTSSTRWNGVTSSLGRIGVSIGIST